MPLGDGWKRTFQARFVRFTGRHQARTWFQVLLARHEIALVLSEREALYIDWKRAVRFLSASPCYPNVDWLPPNANRAG